MNPDQRDHEGVLEQEIQWDLKKNKFASTDLSSKA